MALDPGRRSDSDRGSTRATDGHERDPDSTRHPRSRQRKHGYRSSNARRRARGSISEAAHSSRSGVPVRYTRTGVAKLLGLKKGDLPVGCRRHVVIGNGLVAPKSYSSVQSYISQLDDVSWDHVNDIFKSMEATPVDLLESAGVKAEDIKIERSADMRVRGSRIRDSGARAQRKPRA